MAFFVVCVIMIRQNLHSLQSLNRSLYCAASVGLVGMVPYQHISETSGFPEGFRYRGYNWIAEITAVSYIYLFMTFMLSQSSTYP